MDGTWIEIFRESDVSESDGILIPHNYFVARLRGCSDNIRVSGVGDTLMDALEALASAAGEVEDDIPGVWNREIKEKL